MPEASPQEPTATDVSCPRHGSRLDPELSGAKTVTKALFNAVGHELSVDGEHMLGTRDWPSFNAQSVQVQASGLALMHHCIETDSWEEAGQAWLSALYPQGLVMNVDDSFYLSLGAVA